MIGSVRLKSKSWAFSIASAIEGGAKAAIRARDFTVAEESDRALLRRSEEEESDLGIWGSFANLGMLTTRLGWFEERKIKGLEEAIIELAMATLSFREMRMSN